MTFSPDLMLFQQLSDSFIIFLQNVVISNYTIANTLSALAKWPINYFLFRGLLLVKSLAFTWVK